MQQDDIVWQIIDKKHCAFKLKTTTTSFCRNEYNVTGVCNRQSCPLANSQYATVREFDGRLFLCKKVVERAHMPAKMWELVKLSLNETEARAQITKELEYWPGWLKTKCIQRVKRINEVLKRMRRLEARADEQPILLPKRSKQIKHERNREERAHQVSRLENAIETELLQRLQQGVYGEIYNFNKKAFDGLVKSQGGKADLMEEEDEEEYERMLAAMGDDEFVEALSDEDEEAEFDEELEEELEYDDNAEDAANQTNDLESFSPSDDDDMLADLEDMIAAPSSTRSIKIGAGNLGGTNNVGTARKRPLAKRRGHEIEYEQEAAIGGKKLLARK
jgi:protein MAK16